jgi:uncharacterized RDD family membrane protein YckC
LFYELIIQISLWFIVTFFIIFLFNVETIIHLHLLQFILWLSSGIYFVLSWSRGGQTLAMRAWKLKLVPPNNSWWFFYIRYLLASLGIFLFFVTFLWIFFNKNNRYIHDFILGSKIIDVRS